MSDANPDVLQRELVEASQQRVIAESTENRAKSNYENAKAAAKSARDNEADLRLQYEEAVKATRAARLTAKD